MKAICMHSHGAPSVLAYEDLPAPQLQHAGELLIRVHAASINAADGKVRQGELKTISVFPHTLGRDFSGVVLEATPGAGFAPGDEVFGVLPGGSEGSYAEQLIIHEKWVMRKPPEFSHAQAAAVGLAGLTAMVALDTLQVKEAESVFIQGGAGGVGGFAVILAHRMGTRVLASARPVNHTYLTSLGADRAIDYRQNLPADVLGTCDATLNTVGGTTEQESFTLLRSGGRAAFIGSGLEAPIPNRKDVVSLRPAVERGRPLLARLLRLLPIEEVEKIELTTLPLHKAHEAHEALDSGHIRGKIVLIPEGV